MKKYNLGKLKHRWEDSTKNGSHKKSVGMA
jgi:hypothetical protein